MRASRAALAIAVVLLQAPPVVSWALAPSTKISLEVTQAIQDVNNNITLVAWRRTAVRVRLKIDNAAGLTVASITRAKLTVSPEAGNPPAPRIGPPLNRSEFLAFLKSKKPYDRAQENHTLNFRVDDLEAGEWKFQVEVDFKFDDGTTATEKGTTEPLKCVEVRPIYFCFIPMKYKTADGKERGAPDKAKLKAAEELLKACFPLPEFMKIEWKDEQYIPVTEKERHPGSSAGCGPGILDAEEPSGDDPSDVSEALDDLFDLKGDTEKNLKRLNPKIPDVYCFGWVKSEGEEGQSAAELWLLFSGCPDPAGEQSR